VPDLERILQNTPGSLSQQWYENGVAVDPGTVNVNVTRADGSALITGGAVSGTGTGARTLSLSTTHTALLDRLTVTWISTGKGTLVSYVEVVGGFLFSLAELTALKPTNATWTTAQLVSTRMAVEESLEDACGVAFVPRYARETVSGTGTTGLLLKWPKVRAIRAASSTYNGTTTTLSASDLLGLTWGSYAGLYGYSWTQGYPWIVGYEHGYDGPPERVRQAALLLAKSWLFRGPIDDRASVFNAGADGGTYSLVVPGRNGSVFGLPEVDTVVSEYGHRALVA
jgi:hypothetical protein